MSNYIACMHSKHPSGLEEHIGYWLRCLSNFVSGGFAAKLARHDITVAQWVVLRTLYDHAGISLNEAARIVGVDKSSLSRLMERLVQRALVSRTQGKDRRSLQLSLTPAGEKLVPQLAAMADDNDSTFFQTLSARQREEFLATIRQLLSANGWEATTRGQDRME